MLYKNLPPADCPHNRIREIGPAGLSDAELFAIVIDLPDTETAHRLAAYYHEVHNLGAMQRGLVCQILDTHKASTANRKADTLAAIFELARRDQTRTFVERPAIHSPQDIAALLQYEMAALEHEELRVINLDTRNRVVKITPLYRGSLNSSSVRVGEVFKDAIRINAAAIAVVHNHPSGDPTPSPEDITVTRALVQAGKMLDIQVLDHVIVSQGRFVSLKERGLGF